MKKNEAAGPGAAIGGGFKNMAKGKFSVVPGGFENVAQGAYSLAAGRGAVAQHDGSFVWGG